MNIPNLLTLSRVPITLVIVFLIISQIPWSLATALFLFVLAALTDWLDGFVARLQGLTSDFGKLMDALVDKILILGVLGGLLVGGSFNPNSPFIPDVGLLLPLLGGLGFVVILAREFGITGLRLIAAGRGIVLAAEKSGKIKTCLQILALGLLLLAEVVAWDLPNLFSESESSEAMSMASYAEWVYIAGYIVFFLAVLQTLYSGIRYAMRYRDLLSEPKG